jgi:hypothetical protein
VQECGPPLKQVIYYTFLSATSTLHEYEYADAYATVLIPCTCVNGRSTLEDGGGLQWYEDIVRASSGTKLEKKFFVCLHRSCGTTLNLDLNFPSKLEERLEIYGYRIVMGKKHVQ